jgi:hypothetical protein
MSISISNPVEVNVVNVGDEISQTNLDAINAASGASTANPFVTTTTTQEGTGIYTTIEAGGITVASPAMGSIVFVGSSSIAVGNTTIDHMSGISGGNINCGDITCSSITFPDQTVLTTAGGGGGSFNQSLNTTDSVDFKNTLYTTTEAGFESYSVEIGTSLSAFPYGVRIANATTAVSTQLTEGQILISDPLNGDSFNATPSQVQLQNYDGTTNKVLTLHAENGITFPDGTILTTAAGGGGGGTTINGPYFDMMKPWIVAWNPNTNSFTTSDANGRGQLFLDQGGGYQADFGYDAGFGSVPAIRVTADGWTTWTELRGDGIRFPDGTTQTTAAGGGGGGSPTVVNLIGTGVTYTAQVGDRIFLVDGGIQVDLTFLYTEPVGIEITVVNQDATNPATIGSAFSGVRGSNQIAIQSAAKFVTGADGYWHRIV